MQPRFKVDDRVRLVNCSHITGLTGTVLGVASRHGNVDFLIVLLDRPLPQGQKAVTVIDSCLELISTILSVQEAMENYCTWLEELNIHYEESLRLCISRAGNPDPVEACRLVIKTAQEALDSWATYKNGK
jgi:hypothetical protein